MGKKTKIGKQRKDKYYQLAKETGFRSRAAFKLIQLNRKFEFLQKSRVCIDLCAAPGGWMQVAKQNMPVSSIVVGVDLFPIKPVPGCISITEDITSDKCRVQLQKELKTWKADVVLNDGAPNVGKNWLHDAYQQSCLTLSALKLATEFLRQGGWFVTKIFRSKDYHPLIWVFKQLFKKVHSTKPQASRSESAEIFVVCQYYIAPHKIDNRFLDPKYVFEELDIGNEGPKINVFHPEKSKAKAIGYPEGSSSLHFSVNATALLQGEPLDILQTASEVVFDDDTILNHPLTTPEIKECCKDIRVLGRKDLRGLLNWCKAMKKSLTEVKDVVEVAEEKGKEEEEEAKSEEDEELKELEEEEKEIEKISSQIKELEVEERRNAKRKRKQMLKERRKLRDKMNLKMVLRGDEGPQLNENIDPEDSMFELKLLKKKKELAMVTDDTPDLLAEDQVEKKRSARVVRFKDEAGDDDDDSDSGSSLDSTLGYSRRKKTLARKAGEDEESEDEAAEKDGLGLSSEDEGSESGLSEKESESSDDDEEEEEKTEKPIGEKKSALITDLDDRPKSLKRQQKAELWFQKDAFKDLEDEEDEDYELSEFITKAKKKPKMEDDKALENGADQKLSTAKAQKTSKMANGNNDANEDEMHSDDNDDTDSDDDTDSEDEADNVHKNQSLNKKTGKDGFEVVPAGKGKVKKRKLDAEALALGTLLATSKKSKRDITDMAWNRYCFNDREGLPDWFVDDEKKHMKKEVPVPKELVEEFKAREREMNVRPIKKVIEAKARKKKRAIRRMEKARKRVESLMENSEVTEREKAKQIKQLYKKATMTKKKEVKYVVAKKFTTAKRGGRPAGHKGLYKVVDPRMKKDMRKMKANSKKGNKSKVGKKLQRPKKSKR